MVGDLLDNLRRDVLVARIVCEELGFNCSVQMTSGEEEANDGLVLAESALLGSSTLLTSDEHLRSIDLERLSYELQTFSLSVPVMATPREIVRKFFR
jgi:hypothetical protein